MKQVFSCSSGPVADREQALLAQIAPNSNIVSILHDTDQESLLGRCTHYYNIVEGNSWPFLLFESIVHHFQSIVHQALYIIMIPLLFQLMMLQWILTLCNNKALSGTLWSQLCISKGNKESHMSAEIIDHTLQEDIIPKFIITRYMAFQHHSIRAYWCVSFSIFNVSSPRAWQTLALQAMTLPKACWRELQICSAVCRTWLMSSAWSSVAVKTQQTAFSSTSIRLNLSPWKSQVYLMPHHFWQHSWFASPTHLAIENIIANNSLQRRVFTLVSLSKVQSRVPAVDSLYKLSADQQAVLAELEINIMADVHPSRSKMPLKSLFAWGAWYCDNCKFRSFLYCHLEA